MNITDYTGIAYNFRTMNCWQFVRMVRADVGIDTPKFDVASPVGIGAAFDAGHQDSKGLVSVTEPRNYDAILMATKIGSRMVWHAGVYYDGMVSHCERAAKQVRLESLADIKRKYQEIEFWR